MAPSTFASPEYHFLVSWKARTWKARSFGRNAVSGTVPSARTATGLEGLAARTAPTALSRMSKSYQFRSKPDPSAASKVARLEVPVGGADCAAGPAAAAGAVSTSAAAVPAAVIIV